jgi:drug/metabolite transporter (DMT)-like permease
VTYLIPPFAILWGFVLLGESLSASIVAGCAIIFLGTALTTGILAPRRARSVVGIGETPAPR